jgi:hypothetical protein
VIEGDPITILPHSISRQFPLQAAFAGALSFTISYLLAWSLANILASPESVASGFFFLLVPGAGGCLGIGIIIRKPWRNQWPKAERAAQEQVMQAKRQGDPLAKPDLMGDFCQTYDISKAIPAFLPTVYKASDKMSKQFRLTRLIIGGGLASAASLWLGLLSSDGIMGITDVVCETALASAIINSIIIGAFAGGPMASAIMLPVCTLGFQIGALGHQGLLNTIGLPGCDLLSFALIGLYEGFVIGFGLGLYLVLRKRYYELKSALPDQAVQDAQARLLGNRAISRWLIRVALMLLAVLAGSVLLWWVLEMIRIDNGNTTIFVQQPLV